ncbi:sulfate adenylyltransferase subunit CysD [Algoriphagus zhangzhouensis]|uniref:Sulfate adenylyltransferase subunit 2 n=1 Tax=Algoriphagus zhangzhouensis TaxID=1073327 RepID=A0A1M7Z428_9BACT|nr:sulfate adenylyltransferase subunit CysD [Algoriphagus zhangzhouensis]TDY48359.1 sulfate adenylyltransferase subunit 2 [Algoriphagus zhangzhouensis]SHO59406.1 sulfate adenylyltransferase subunit 2 [Algoriphagus zhangzhouensis]
MGQYYLSHLKELEAEAIFIIREVVSQFERPALLFSGGKDSILLAHLAKKAFYPAKIPFPLIHIDTGHNFPETLEFRDALVEELGVQLVVGSVQESIDKGRVREETGVNASRNALQTVTLLDTLEDLKIDAAMGGARRDEEKARAKERFFSHRDEFGQWDPKNQRPELWNLFNGRKHHGEHFRIFPISNWTEMDVWQYIKEENIALPSLYFSHERECIVRDEVILAKSEFLPLKEGEEIQKLIVRYRTCGDMPITGAVLSNADTLELIIEEVATTRTTERGTRADDKRGETAMEDRKKAGYF